MTFKLYLLLIALSYLRVFELFAPQLAPLRPMLLLMLIVLGLSIIDLKKQGGSALSKQHQRLMWGIIGMVFLSSLLAAGFGDAIGSLIAFLPTPMLFFISGMNLTSMDRVKRTAATIIGCLAILGIMSVACYHTGFMVDTLTMKENGTGPDSGFAAVIESNDIPALDTSGRYLWRIRSVGFLGDPNDYAQTMVCFLPLLLTFWRPGHAMRTLLVIAPTVTLLLYTIYLTRSRGALLGLSSLFFLTVRKRLGNVLTAGLVVGIFVGAMALNFTGGRAVSSKDESAGGRIEAWAQGLNMLTYHPVAGVGYHRFSDHHTHTAHNTLVVCFGELGLLGYWVWLGLVLMVFTQLSRAADAALPGTDEQLWATRAKMSFIGFFVCSMFLSRAFEPQLFILLVISIGIWNAVCKQLQGTPQGVALAATLPWRSRTFFWAIGTILFFYVLVNVNNILLGR